MSGLLYLIPIALVLWALKSGQFEDPEGAAARILLDDDLDTEESDQSPRISR
jgi:cbb3-type cytochrome oxidase maturation protein